MFNVSVLLDCGTLDLEMIEKCEYDFSDIKDLLKEFDMEMTFSNIIYCCIYQYKVNLQEKIDAMIEETENEIKMLEIESDEKNGHISFEKSEELTLLWKKKEELESLDTNEDIEEYINYLDTHIYLDSSKEEIYTKYLGEEIDKENELLGFCELNY